MRKIMVGLSDIPCVGVAVDKVSDATVEAGIRRLCYLLCPNNLVNDLNYKIGKVQIEEDGVARKVAEAKDDGKIIENHVMAWQENVENIKTNADDFLRLGRKVAHVAKAVTKNTDSGMEFLANEVGHHPHDEYVSNNSGTSYQRFGSRQEAYGRLWDALVNEDGYPISGIYGMPGVGKTRMMEQASKEAKETKIFGKVTRANVGGEKFYVIKLPDGLEGYLNRYLESKDNKVQRASPLKRVQ